MRVRARILVLMAVISAWSTSVVSADIISVEAISRGCYRATGTPGCTGTGTPEGFYFAGNTLFASGTSAEHRNFFIFDLGAIGPLEVVTGATLELRVSEVGFASSAPSESLSLFDVATSPASLTNGTAGVAGFNDLGTGSVFGSRTFTAADRLTTVSIVLNALALGAINSAPGLFALGGAVTTLDGTVLPDVSLTEGVLGGCGPGCISRLTLETVPIPEPSSLLLLGSGLGLVARRLLARRRDAQGSGG